MRASLLLAAWLIARGLFLAVWYVAYPLGVAQAWLATRYRETQGGTA